MFRGERSRSGDPAEKLLVFCSDTFIAPFYNRAFKINASPCVLNFLISQVKDTQVYLKLH